MTRSSSQSEPKLKILNPQIKPRRRGLNLDELYRVPAVSGRHCLSVFEREKERQSRLIGSVMGDELRSTLNQVIFI